MNISSMCILVSVFFIYSLIVRYFGWRKGLNDGVKMCGDEIKKVFKR